MKLQHAAALFLTAASSTATAATAYVLDGRLDDSPLYDNSSLETWYQGHKVEFSIYGDSSAQTHTTTIHYGVGTLSGETSGVEYFFLYVEVPLYAKNMIWQDLGKDGWKDEVPLLNENPLAGLTEADVASYREHHETHHGVGDMKLDFGGATGSEKMVLGPPPLPDPGTPKPKKEDKPKAAFEANLAGGITSSDTNAYGLLGSKDSVDYLLDPDYDRATEALSLNRDTTMSFEFQFALDAEKNEAFLELFDKGIEFHLSPERGLNATAIPEPFSVATLGALLGLGLCTRNRKQSETPAHES